MIFLSPLYNSKLRILFSVFDLTGVISESNNITEKQRIYQAYLPLHPSFNKTDMTL